MMTRNRLSLRLGLPAGLLSALAAGCTKTEEIPPADVRVVEAYGVRLDEDASPTEVAYVLLRTLADDVHAARAHQHEKQEEAVEQTFALAAYDDIERRILGIKNLGQKQPKPKLGDDRDEQIFEIVNRWAPIVSYYVESFPGDFDTAKAGFKVREEKTGGLVHVYCDLKHDPAEMDPAKQETATLDIEMVRQSAGSKAYWRVARMSYLGAKERAALHAASQPAAIGTSPA